MEYRPQKEGLALVYALEVVSTPQGLTGPPTPVGQGTPSPSIYLPGSMAQSLVDAAPRGGRPKDKPAVDKAGPSVDPIIIIALLHVACMLGVCVPHRKREEKHIFYYAFFGGFFP